MAPPRTQTTVRNNSNKRNQKSSILTQLYTKYFNLKFIKFLLCEPAAYPIVSVLILISEFVLNVLVINKVPYTEIDWIAYMQECEGFLNGTTNYALLKGDTGPLVYPAGFVYIYTILYYITSHGTNIRLAQYIFMIIYLLQIWLVLRIYGKNGKVPPYVMIISIFTSYRIHSIYILRLFNDPIAVLFLYAALNLFIDRHWIMGSICYSLGVGVKMNILLFAPALLLYYITNLGYVKTLIQLTICGVIQLILGSPFILTYPVEYLKGSFDLGRIFEHKWTVNYRFLSREFFEHQFFHIILLLLHLLLLGIFAKPFFMYFKNYARIRELQKQLEPQLKRKNVEMKNSKKTNKTKKTKAINNEAEEELTAEQKTFLESFEKSLQNATGQKVPSPPKEPQEVENETVSIEFDQCSRLALLPLFLANFIGIICARSLHYQFYVWYFHSLPYLTWATGYSLTLRFLILGLIELCWNTYPSTNFSSYTLHVCHFILLLGVGRTMFETIRKASLVRNSKES